MRRLSFIILLILPAVLYAQSPHGKEFKIVCDNCHTSSDWSVSLEKVKFDHTSTGFELTGQHQSVSCKSCHESLKFNDARTECFTCHTDVHENSVGKDCESCHQTNTWIVSNIYELHELQRFPLLGVHLTAVCEDCHVSSSQLNFTPLGVNCVDCHLKDYQSTSTPNHVTGGFSTECEDCHSFTGDGWTSSSIAHTFFPLVGGHDIGNCFECHSQGTYAGLSQECFTCHQSDYQSATVVNHQSLALPTNCEMCHTLNPGWSQAQFPIHDNYFELTGAHFSIRNECADCHEGNYSNTSSECFSCHGEDFNSTQNPQHLKAGFSHDCTECHNTTAWIPSTFDHDAQYFPIYSGSHNGEWDNCNECHTTTNNYSDFSCLNCHEHAQSQMDSEHSGISGYSYNSSSCFGCHPTGRSEGFNHSVTQFPLLGVHSVTLCSDCHTAGYAGTSMECYACHQQNFNSSVNPNHQSLGLSTSCEECHTSDPSWQPALFPEHNSYFEFTGAHAAISNDCNTCHNGNYTSTSSECSSCHSAEYNATVNPSHVQAGFSLACEDCHSTTAWIPADFDHDSQYFPIFSGSHNGTWADCSECHTQLNNYAVFSCINCHEHNQSETDSKHSAIGGYSYTSTACFDCHPTGNENGFNHSITEFPLLGVHAQTSCTDCHAIGYQSIPTECISCHQPDYSSTSNPSHQNLGLDTACENCHTPEPGWKPALFPIHSDYYMLSGAHVSLNPACSDCHDGNYNNNKTECVDCHINNFNTSSNPNHQVLNLSQQCSDCHNTEPDWQPAQFPLHDNYYILTGAHVSLSPECSDCHEGNYTTTRNLCYDCHKKDFESSVNPSHLTIGISTNCEECHSTQQNWQPALFTIHDQFYPLTGAHLQIADNCNGCHKGNYINSGSLCYDCHQDNYNSALYPNHLNLGFPTECGDCHASDTDWKPATFTIHNQFYELLGAHAIIANDCTQCHNATYTENKNTCYACHLEDYNNATSPLHNPGFPTTCDNCHSQNAWKPSTFDHDSQYFPIYSGKHQGEWNSCTDCHTTSNYSSFSCIDCHEHSNKSSVDGEHDDVSNYVYSATSCYSCHPDGRADD